MSELELERAASIEALEIVVTFMMAELMTAARLRDWSNHTATLIEETPIEERHQARVLGRVDDLFLRARRKLEAGQQ